MKLLNIAAYKFISLDNLVELKTALYTIALENHLLGTILFSKEGINLMLTGLTENIEAFRDYLKSDSRFADLHYKESYPEEQTYNRLLVKIKKEIIAFDVETVDPIHQQTPYIKPKELKQWLDEKRQFVFLDIRNVYEIEAGTFEQASHLNIRHFKHFPAAAKNLDDKLKKKTIVTFCTGGIRCEKAALLLQQYGFKDVYQLEGGILDYFAKCGNAHYQGDCFVFDKRGGLSADDFNNY
jgi:predicted sulfurtransferase